MSLGNDRSAVLGPSFSNLGKVDGLIGFDSSNYTYSRIDMPTCDRFQDYSCFFAQRFFGYAWCITISCSCIMSHIHGAFFCADAVRSQEAVRLLGTRWRVSGTIQMTTSLVSKIHVLLYILYIDT
jgi:hypothetical protein